MENLLVFHQGYAQSGRLWCNALDDGLWQGDVQAPDTGMTDSPSPVEFNGRLYCFHQGFAQSGQLWYNVYDGMEWLGDMGVRQGTPASDANAVPVLMSYSPGVVAFNGRIYCFFQGAGEDGRLYVASFDGSAWSIDGNPAPNTYLANSPAAVVWGNEIYVYHQGRDGQGRPDGTMWYNKYNGRNWDQDRQTPISGMSASPSAVAYQNRLYVFHQHSGEDGRLFVFDATGWGPDIEIPGSGVCMSESPGAVVLGDRLYCFYQGAGKSGALYFSSFFSNTWALVNVPVSNTGMTSSPAVLATTLPPPPAAVIAPNPAETRVASFEGWGTSLCWWANLLGGQTGPYGASYLADLFFGSGAVTTPGGGSVPGLGLNIVRYNIGD